MTEENLEEAMEGLEYEVEGTFLEDLDEQTIQTEFRELLQNSIFYSLSRRCGLDPMDVFGRRGFYCNYRFSFDVSPSVFRKCNQSDCRTDSSGYWADSMENGLGRTKGKISKKG